MRFGSCVGEGCPPSLVQGVGITEFPPYNFNNEFGQFYAKTISSLEDLGGW